MIPRPSWAALTLTLLLPSMALSQPAPQPAQQPDPQPDHPFVVPQRDVDILYAMPIPVASPTPGSQAAATQRMRFNASLARQRVDPPGPGTYMITDFATGRLIVVQPQQRLATTLPAPGGPIAAHGRRAIGRYRRLGPQTIAGAPCTDWATTDDSGRASVVCLTADGVMLRAMQSGQLLVQAIHLDYAEQPASVFAVPDGYHLQNAPPPG